MGMKVQDSQKKELIKPIDISKEVITSSPLISKKLIINGIFFVFTLILIFILWFVLSAKTIVVEIEPSPDTLQLKDGSLSFQLEDRFLAQPGKYQLHANKNGYFPLQEEITVGMLSTYTIRRALQKKPGIISIFSDSPTIARVYIDRHFVGHTPLKDIYLSPGSHSIELQRYRFRPFLSDIQIEGAEKIQSFTFEMIPDWAPVSINSKPEGAQVWINGEKAGKTPATLTLDAGTHHFELVHSDFAAHIADIVVLPNQPLDLGIIELNRSPNYLFINSLPTNATVFMNGRRVGVTPLTLTISPNVNNQLRFIKPGYQELSRTVRASPGESKTLNVGLQAILGTVQLQVKPESAIVLVNGKLVGRGSQILSLTTSSHTIEVKESGYIDYKEIITPQVNKPIKKVVSLNLRKQFGNKIPGSIINSEGQKLLLINPGSFTMGTSRREQGRRANETLRNVKLQRKFYIGVKEITNEEFFRFNAEHNSGSFRGIDLSTPNSPVVNVSWEQAARYCNWLSKKEDLPLAYREQSGNMVANTPILTGYRLVTEAEWAWVARTNTSDKSLLRYAWGTDYPPNKLNGNYADQQANRIIGLTIPGNDDGYAGPSPVGSFVANQNGLFDIDGNVAEWMHDYYTIYSSPVSQEIVDPAGPIQGKHHVVRGASWLRGTLSNTRLAYRDYRNKPQADIGFRIARYIN